MSKRVLIVNKFYYPRGGDCVCTINLESLLKAQGHEVAIYAMTYPENIHSEYSKYFAPEVEFKGGISNKIKAASRIFGYADVASSFKKILNDFKPDVVHFQNIHSYLSPIIVKIAHEYGTKVVWTLHDYKLICPSYSCLKDGVPCELCFTDKWNVVKNKCMKGSLLGSILAFGESKMWNYKSLERWTDAFVCPSSFMASKMKQNGFSKLNVICNFLDPVKLNILKNMPLYERENYYIYVGRLSKEKGIETLLEVASELPYALKIAGSGPLEVELKDKYRDNNNIEFLGHLNASEISNLLSKAKFSIIPSEWYENNPLSLIESLCSGTPVVGTNIGGIPELINSENGIITEPKNKTELKNSINIAWNKEWDNKTIKNHALKIFSPEVYYNKVIELYT